MPDPISDFWLSYTDPTLSWLSRARPCFSWVQWPQRCVGDSVVSLGQIRASQHDLKFTPCRGQTLAIKQYLQSNHIVVSIMTIYAKNNIWAEWEGKRLTVVNPKN